MISQSQIKTMRRCHKKHDYKHNQHLAKKVRAAPLFRGTILHEMIQAKCLGKDPYAVSRDYAKKYRQLFREQREEYGETFMEDIDRVFAGWERATAADGLKYEIIEEKGSTNLPNGLEIAFIVDAIAIDKNKRRWLIDRKTHKVIPDDKARASDIQLVLYYWAWNKEHPKKPIDGIMWDYLRTKPPTIPEVLKNGQLTQRVNIDTDFYTYAREVTRLQLEPRLYKETLDRLKGRGSIDFFERVTLPSPSLELIKSIVEDAAETAWFIDNHGEKARTRNLTRNCSFDCEFYNLCQAELRGLDADFVRKTDYEEKDPNERYKGNEEE